MLYPHSTPDGQTDTPLSLQEVQPGHKEGKGLRHMARKWQNSNLTPSLLIPTSIPFNFTKLGLPGVSQPLAFGPSGLWWPRPAFPISPWPCPWHALESLGCRHTRACCRDACSSCGHCGSFPEVGRRFFSQRCHSWLQQWLVGKWPWLSQDESVVRQT